MKTLEHGPGLSAIAALLFFSDGLGSSDRQFFWYGYRQIGLSGARGHGHRDLARNRSGPRNHRGCAEALHCQSGNTHPHALFASVYLLNHRGVYQDFRISFSEECR